MLARHVGASVHLILSVFQRLEEEKRDMKWKIADLEGQCSLLSSHLEAVVQKLDAAMAGQSEYDVASGQEVLALKKEVSVENMVLLPWPNVYFSFNSLLLI